MATASTARTKETVQKLLEAANAHDVKKLGGMYADSAEVFDPAYNELLRGREAIEKDMDDFLKAFPDLEIELERLVEKGNEAAYEIRIRGTHKGPLVGPTGTIPATGRRMEIGGAFISRIDEEGRVTEERRYYNLAGLLEQVGQLQ